MRTTDWDLRLRQLEYDYSHLAECRFLDCPEIPLSQYLQFRRLRTKLAVLSEKGFDIDAMTTEQCYGACLVAPQKTRVFWTRCEFDLELSESLFNQISKNLVLLRAWFVTNLTASDSRLISVPLGLNDYCGYSQFHKIAGDLTHFDVKSTPSRTTAVLCCINPNTHQKSRLPLLQIAKSVPSIRIASVNTTLEGFKWYINALKGSEFVLCPRGNGIDTHRFWEALYLGCIPICHKADLLDCHKSLPHLALDDWSQLRDIDYEFEATKIRTEIYDLRKLCIDYWIDRVRYIHGF
jgi:hypothetical protein